MWTDTSLNQLVVDEDRVTGAVLDRGGDAIEVTARRARGVGRRRLRPRDGLARKFQSASLGEGLSLGSEGNTGDAIRMAQDIGADIALMDQAWWFPAFAPLPGADPLVMLAERSLPGSLIVDQSGSQFVNEACDYMSYGQRVLELERTGHPVEPMWLIFDQGYRNNYLMAAELFPRMPIPQSWYDAEIAYRSGDLADLAARSVFPTTRSATRWPASTKWRPEARTPTSTAVQCLRPVLRRPDGHPEPEPAASGSRPVLCGEDGAE